MTSTCGQASSRLSFPCNDDIDEVMPSFRQCCMGLTASLCCVSDEASLEHHAAPLPPFVIMLVRQQLITIPRVTHGTHLPFFKVNWKMFQLPVARFYLAIEGNRRRKPTDRWALFILPYNRWQIGKLSVNRPTEKADRLNLSILMNCGMNGK